MMHRLRLACSDNYFLRDHTVYYGSAEGPPRGVENRNLLSHPDDLRMEVYVIRMT